MKEDVLRLFEQYAELAFVISILLNIVIAVLGLVPSFFLTAANILFFGFWKGTLISFCGEAIGAWIAFMLYRKGFKKGVDAKLARFPKAQRLVEAKGREAFLLIFSLRLLPFVPSGLVTFAGAIGSVSAVTFVLASSLGKVPALLIEAWSVYQVTQFNWQGKVVLSVVAVVLLYLALREINVIKGGRKKSKNE